MTANFQGGPIKIQIRPASLFRDMAMRYAAPCAEFPRTAKLFT
jgi:hypothetical protein